MVTKTLSILLLVLCFSATYAKSLSYSDSLYRVAKQGDENALISYVKLYSYDNPEKVESFYETIVSLAGEKSRVEGLILYDLLLDALKYNNDSTEVSRYTKLAQVYTDQSVNLNILDYFDFKYAFLDQDKDPNEFRREGERLLLELKNRKNWNIKASISHMISESALRAGRYKDAEEYANKAIKLFDGELTYSLLDAHCIQARAATYTSQYKVAYQCLDNAMTLSSRYKLLKTSADLNTIAGKLCISQLDIDNALRFLLKAKNTKEKQGGVSLSTLINLSICYQKIGMRDTAVYYHEMAEAHELAKNHRIDLCLNSARVYSDAAGWFSTIAKLDSCIAISEDLNRRGVALGLKAGILLDQGEYLKSIDYGHQAEAILENQGYVGGDLIEVLETIEKAYMALGLYKQALNVRIKHDEIAVNSTEKSVVRAKVLFYENQLFSEQFLGETGPRGGLELKKKLRDSYWIVIFLYTSRGSIYLPDCAQSRKQARAAGQSREGRTRVSKKTF